MSKYKNFIGNKVSVDFLFEYLKGNMDDFEFMPPIDVEKITLFLEIKLKTKPDFRKPEVVGSIYLNKDSVPEIWVNPLENRTEERRRFTIAHELGHFFRHITTNKTFIENSFFNPIEDADIQFNRDQSWDILEFEANTFAANLLMPQKLVYDKILEITHQGSKKIEETGLIENLAAIFCVSNLAMEIRLKRLEII